MTCNWLGPIAKKGWGSHLGQMSHFLIKNNKYCNRTVYQLASRLELEKSVLLLFFWKFWLLKVCDMFRYILCIIYFCIAGGKRHWKYCCNKKRHRTNIKLWFVLQSWDLVQHSFDSSNREHGKCWGFHWCSGHMVTIFFISLFLNIETSLLI